MRSWRWANPFGVLGRDPAERSILRPGSSEEARRDLAPDSFALQAASTIKKKGEVFFPDILYLRETGSLLRTCFKESITDVPPYLLHLDHMNAGRNSNRAAQSMIDLHS